MSFPLQFDERLFPFFEFLRDALQQVMRGRAADFN